jgi:hypothetical protein
MGHASITTTEIYSHFIPQADAAAVGSAGLSEMLNPSTELSTEPQISPAN